MASATALPQLSCLRLKPALALLLLVLLLAAPLLRYAPNLRRARLRKFPSLVNCCTIDWFSEWPSDALKSVASQFLKVCAANSDL